MAPPTVHKEALALKGAKIRQYYPGYGEGEPNEQKGEFGLGVFAGEVTDVWQEEDKEDDEVGLRVVFTIEYEDDDVDDVGFRQLTAMTRGSKNLQGGYAKVAVVLDDELQDKEVIRAVRKAAADAGMNLGQECPNVVCQYARQLQIQEELTMIGLSVEQTRTVGKAKRQGKGSKRGGASSGDKGSAEPPKKTIRSGLGRGGGGIGHDTGGSPPPQTRHPPASTRLNSLENGAVPAPARRARVPDNDEDMVLDEGRDECELLLTCPISKKRMQKPVKGQDCTHLACFERKNFVDLHRNYFTVTRVEMLKERFATFTEIDSQDVEVMGIDPTQRFEEKGEKDVIPICIKVNNINNVANRRQKLSEKFVQHSIKLIDSIRAQTCRDKHKQFPQVPKIEIPGWKLDFEVEDEGRDWIKFKILLPVNPAACPVDSCKMKISTLRPVQAMEELLTSLSSADDEVVKSVIADSRYRIIKQSTDTRSTTKAKKVPNLRDEVMDLEVTPLQIVPLPAELRCLVKIEPGFEEESPRKVTTKSSTAPSSGLLSSMLAAEKRVMPRPVTATNNTQSNVVETSTWSSRTQDKVHQPQQQKQQGRIDDIFEPGDHEGYLSGWRPGKDGKSYFGFVFASENDIAQERKNGVFCGEKSFGGCYSKEFGRLLHEQKRVHRVSFTTYNSGSRTHMKNLDFLEERDAFLRALLQEAHLQGAQMPAATQDDAAEESIEADDLKTNNLDLPVLLNGSFLCRMTLKYSSIDVSSPLFHRLQSEQNLSLDLTHTLPGSAVLSSSVQMLDFMALEPCPNSKDEAVRVFSNKLSDNNLFSVAALRSSEICADQHEGTEQNILVIPQEASGMNLAHPSFLVAAEIPSS